MIEISQNKLNIDPKINDVSNTNRVAVFELVDGELTITCDGDRRASYRYNKSELVNS